MQLFGCRNKFVSSESVDPLTGSGAFANVRDTVTANSRSHPCLTRVIWVDSKLKWLKCMRWCNRCTPKLSEPEIRMTVGAIIMSLLLFADFNCASDVYKAQTNKPPSPRWNMGNERTIQIAFECGGCTFTLLHALEHHAWRQRALMNNKSICRTEYNDFRHSKSTEWIPKYERFVLFYRFVIRFPALKRFLIY